MFGRNRNPMHVAGDAAESTRDRVATVLAAGKAGAAAGGALGLLGTKMGDIMHEAGKRVDSARDSSRNGAADAGRSLNMLGKRSDDAWKQIENSLRSSVTVDNLPRLWRGLALMTAGAATLFAPGSAMDVVGDDPQDSVFVRQAREGLGAASAQTRQQIKEAIGNVRNGVSALSEALIDAIDVAESKTQQALQQTEARLTDATDQVADRADTALRKQEKKGGRGRWLLLGVALGGGVAYLQSPPGRRLFQQLTGMGQDAFNMADAAQSWPGQTQSAQQGQAAADPQVSASDAPGSDYTKTEAWSNEQHSEDIPRKG